jgi:hypothetical protein
MDDMKRFCTEDTAMFRPTVPRRPGTRVSCTSVLSCLRHGPELLTATVEHVLPPSSEYTCVEAVAVCSCSANLNGKILVRAEMNIIDILEARVIAIMTPCIVLSRRQSFGRIWCLHFQGEEGT